MAPTPPKPPSAPPRRKSAVVARLTARAPLVLDRDLAGALPSATPPAPPAPLEPAPEGSFLAHMRAKGLRPTSTAQYARYVVRAAEWAEKLSASGVDLPITDDHRPDREAPPASVIVAFARSVVNDLSPTGTRSSWRAFVNHYCAWAGYMIADPPLFKSVRAKQHKFREAMTADELRAWNTAVDEAALPRYIETILRLIPIMGFRVSEVCQLRWEGIAEAPRPSVRFVEKGGTVGSLPIVPGAWTILTAYRTWAEAVGYDVRRGPVFPGAVPTKSITAEAVRYHTRKIERAAGLPKEVTPHVLRHTFATLALEQGVDLAVVKAVLRHRNIKTTALYLHPTEGMQAKAMDKMADLVSVREDHNDEP